MIWKPNVTVAAVINNNDRYLLVEEKTTSGILFNQPAGHLEPNETTPLLSITTNINKGRGVLPHELSVNVCKPRLSKKPRGGECMPIGR